VSTRNYRPLQMHRIAYSDLTEAQVSQALRAAASGPASKFPLSNALAGKRLTIVTDGGGPTLEYSFHSARELELSETGSKAIKCGYGALQERSLVLVSHMIPGTQRGYHLVVDQQSGLATVFEVHFSGYAEQEKAAAAAARRAPQFKNGQRNREVQRKIWFGYVQGSGAVPTARHTYTNRLEGKGIYWKQDNDIEILEFYLTILYSNFIELTRFGGEMTVAAPSDYIMVNDHQFIYSRIECEFTGTYTLQIIDLFDVTQKGVRLGLTDKDELEYYMYGGKGEITGQSATFEVFGNNSLTRAGPRRVYRPLETFDVMSDDQVIDQVINHAVTFGDGTHTGAASMGGYRGELITRFAGKQLTIRMDNGPAIEYAFDDGRSLRWRYAGENQWREARYEMYEPDDELYFFAHLLDAEFPRSCAMVALDMKNGLATLVKGTTGTPFRNN
jgi:hypothetical protein